MDRRDYLNVRQPLYMLIYSTRNLIGLKSLLVFVGNIVLTSLVYLMCTRLLNYDKQIVSIFVMLWITVAFVVGWFKTQKVMHNLLYSKKFCSRLAEIMPAELKRMMLKAYKYHSPILLTKGDESDSWATYMIKLQILKRVTVVGNQQAAYDFHPNIAGIQLERLIEQLTQYTIEQKVGYDTANFKATP